MKKDELQKSLEKATGAALVSITDVARWSGRSRDYVREHITRGLEHITNGKTKLYFSGDIAEKMAKMKVR